MKLFILVISLLLSLSAYPQAPKKVQVLDVWACEEYKCAILLADDGRFLLAVADDKGVFRVFHRSVLIWQRGDKDV